MIGGNIVTGGTASFGAGGIDSWLIKLGLNGELLWQRTYGGKGDNSVYSVQQTSDGGYVLAGETFAFGSGNGDLWILKLDGKGYLPDCPIVRVSHATADTVLIRANNTKETGRDTSLIPQASAAMGIDTEAIETTLCYSASGISAPVTIKWGVILFTVTAVLASLFAILRQ